MPSNEDLMVYPSIFFSLNLALANENDDLPFNEYI
jgi:hypothetical protein